MILLLHIIVAITGIVQASYLLVVPSKKGLRVSYALLGLTLASGTFLVISSGAHILQACTTGLLYTGFVTLGMVHARRALAKDAS